MNNIPEYIKTDIRSTIDEFLFEIHENYPTILEQLDKYLENLIELNALNNYQIRYHKISKKEQEFRVYLQMKENDKYTELKYNLTTESIL